MTTLHRSPRPTRHDDDQDRDVAVVVLLALAAAVLVAAWPHHVRPWITAMAARVMGSPTPLGILEVAVVAVPVLALLLVSPALVRRRRDKKAGRCPQDPWVEQTGAPNR